MHTPIHSSHTNFKIKLFYIWKMYVKSINVNLTLGAELTDYTAMSSSAHFKEKALKAEEKRAEEGRPRAKECAFRGCVFFSFFGLLHGLFQSSAALLIILINGTESVLQSG